MSNKDCDREMRIRGMDNPCKDRNSFIVGATKINIQDVCDRAGTPTGEGTLCRSNQPFRVVTCTHQGGSSRRPCNYRANQSMRYIVINCRDNLPVHYERGDIYI
ncbi:ANG4 protein, partial [Amia calva]|nr:ANG4 protein [Amia calva]